MTTTVQLQVIAVMSLQDLDRIQEIRMIDLRLTEDHVLIEEEEARLGVDTRRVLKCHQSDFQEMK
jgi:hypothetical protein